MNLSEHIFNYNSEQIIFSENISWVPLWSRHSSRCQFLDVENPEISQFLALDDVISVKEDRNRKCVKRPCVLRWRVSWPQLSFISSISPLNSNSSQLSETFPWVFKCNKFQTEFSINFPLIAALSRVYTFFVLFLTKLNHHLLSCLNFDTFSVLSKVVFLK